MKLTVLIAVLLLSVSSAEAQHSCQHSPATASTQTFQLSGLGTGSSGSIGSAGTALTYEAPREFKLIYVTNDGNYVPSTYMNYDEALALGRQQIAAGEEMAKNQSKESLGEIARAYRAAKERSTELEAKTVQIDAERLEVCTVRNCHR